MVKCQGRNILASRVDYYYYEFVQALARIITVYGMYIGFLFVYLLVQYMRGVDSKMSEEYEQVRSAGSFVSPPHTSSQTLLQCSPQNNAHHNNLRSPHSNA